MFQRHFIVTVSLHVCLFFKLFQNVSDNLLFIHNGSKSFKNNEFNWAFDIEKIETVLINIGNSDGFSVG